MLIFKVQNTEINIKDWHWTNKNKSVYLIFNWQFLHLLDFFGLLLNCSYDFVAYHLATSGLHRKHTMSFQRL